jgi:hypothetical protein
MINWGETFRQVHDDEAHPPKEVGEAIALVCPHCEIHTSAKVVATFRSPRNKWHSPPASMEVHNAFLTCTRCNGAILVLWPFVENVMYGGITTFNRVYPLPGGPGWFGQDAETVVPKAIAQDIKQAFLCSRVGAPYGAALLFRRAVQYLCRHKKAPDSGLKAQIKWLHHQGIINKPLANQVDSVRVVANDVAHPNARRPARITPQDIDVVADFVRQLIDAVYVGPHRNAALRKDLRKRKVPEA